MSLFAIGAAVHIVVMYIMKTRVRDKRCLSRSHKQTDRAQGGQWQGRLFKETQFLINELAFISQSLHLSLIVSLWRHCVFYSLYLELG